jgi:hypothetical protein
MYGVLSSLLLHPLRYKYIFQHLLLEHNNLPSSEISDLLAYNVGACGCPISQYHPLLCEVSRISVPPSLLRCCIFQYRPFPYVVCHISVLKSPSQGDSHLIWNLYCMRCLISQYVWVVSCHTMSLRLEAFPFFYTVSHISISATGVSYFSTKLSFMRCLSDSWKRHRRREEISDEQAKVTLISNFRRVVNVVCFLLGNSPASEFCMPTFRNTLSVPSS